MKKETEPSPNLSDSRKRLRGHLPHAFLLTGWQWCTVIILFLIVVFGLPSAWRSWETFEPDINYRVPYEASQDYWQYERHLRERQESDTVYFVGDSVVWGEYVTPDGTWTAFLNEQSEGKPEFVNQALNGLYPLALQGLITHYAGGLSGKKVMLHCNLLWMSSPQADLSQTKEQVFNHPTLVPQFRPKIPSYHADMDTRLGRAIGHRWSFLAWVRHLQIQYWDQKDPYAWTLADDGDYPPSYPNTYRMPWSELDFTLLEEPNPDSERGTDSNRHHPWSSDGIGTQRFDWMDLNDSLQWAAFQRLCQLLQQRDNQFIIILGPFNKHIMAEDNRTRFENIESGVKEWLESNNIPFIAPEVLDSSLYGDASHPLTEGYRKLAVELWNDPNFTDWLSQ